MPAGCQTRIAGQMLWSYFVAAGLVRLERNAMTDGTIMEPAPTRVRLKIEGMTCQNCVRHVREALQAAEGARMVDVNLAKGEASVLVKDLKPETAEQLAAAVRAAGYGADTLNQPAPKDSQPAGPAHHSWEAPLLVGLTVTVVLMIGEWALGWQNAVWFRWLSFGLGTTAQFYSGRAFYRGAWRQLKRGQSSMDTLVALGSSTAYLLSVVVLFHGGGGHLHFMEAAAIISFVSLGHWIEARASQNAESALRALMNLAPEQALRQEADGSETSVAVSELKMNDAVVLKPGSAIPTDGTVIEGDSAVDESMLTGESFPVDKALHSRLYAGTINLNGRLVMLVTGTGERTALARIIDAVKQAQASRANIQRLADRVSNVFVPAVVIVALATALWWGLAPESAMNVHNVLTAWLWPVHLPDSVWVTALINMAAVLIVACPCAMGLATPAAIMVAANSASRRGILIRDGVALEKAGKIDTVVFDKTGTLTLGKPKLLRFETYRDGGDRPDLDEMRVAVSLARISNHPISRAVATYGCDPYQVKDCREIRGSGVEGRLVVGTPVARTYRLRLGSLRWLGELDIDLDNARTFIREWQSKGATVLGISAEHWLLGVVALRDELKPGAAAVVAQFSRPGWSVHLVTGDHPASASAIAAEAGIKPDCVLAEASPEQKPEYVESLQKEGHRVAFVGDGINDAPALEKADLGIAVSLAAEISRNAADMVLMRSDIVAIPEALGLARATLAKIRQNLFWAFFYNAAAIPLAALGFINPIFCAALMGLSDVVVIGNALTLYWWKPFRKERLLKALKEGIPVPEDN